MFRDFRPDDQEVVRDLVLAGLRERWGEAFDPTFNTDLEDIFAHYVRRGAEVVVLEHEGQVVATGTLLLEGDDIGRIVRMSVAPSVRRRGVGQSVVAELLSRAATRGLTEVRVLTDRPWTSAVALYRSCGFEQFLDDGVDMHFSLRL